MVRLIDADALVKDLRENYIFTGFNELLDDFASAIRAQPTVDAVPVVHGRWKYDNQFHWYRACCSECGYCRVTDVEADRWNEWKFCPNCGAKMDEVKDDETD